MATKAIQLEINEEVDKIIRLHKAKFDLPNKRESITDIITRYGKEQQLN